MTVDNYVRVCVCDDLTRHNLKMAAEERQTTSEKKAKPIFCELSANDLEPEITKIESLCVECGKNVSDHHV